MSSSSNPINFIVDNFDTSIQLDVCGNLFNSIVTMDVSAVCDLYVDIELVRRAFQFQTDSSNIINSEDEDIKYFIDRDSFWNYDSDYSFAINPADSQINTFETSLLEPIMDSSSEPTKNMVCHDFVRFLSKKLFNTPYGVDLFDNESELLDDIRHKSTLVWSNIDKELTKYDVKNRQFLTSYVALDGTYYDVQENSSGEYGPDSWKYYLNDDTENVSKKLLDQISTQNPARLQNIQDTTDIQPIPFLAGDTISLKLTISPANGQHNLTGVVPIGSRTFRIRYNLVNDHKPFHVRDIERSIFEFVTYRKFTPNYLIGLLYIPLDDCERSLVHYNYLSLSSSTQNLFSSILDCKVLESSILNNLTSEDTMLAYSDIFISHHLF